MENRLVNKEELLSQAQALHQLLLDKGFMPFLERFLQSNFSEGTVLENLLKREDGQRLYRDLRQLAQLMAQQQIKEHLSVPGLVQWLLQLKRIRIG